MAHKYTPPPLPPHGEPFLISQISSQSKSLSKLNGKTVRVVGRVKEYDPNSQVLMLVEPSSSSRSKTEASSSKTSSSNSALVVDMQLTDAEDCRLGSQVMIIGELERWEESRLSDLSHELAINLTALKLEIFGNENCDSGKSDIVLKAVISKCVDTLDYTLYLRCIPIWKGEVI